MKRTLIVRTGPSVRNSSLPYGGRLLTAAGSSLSYGSRLLTAAGGSLPGGELVPRESEDGRPVPRRAAFSESLPIGPTATRLDCDRFAPVPVPRALAPIP